MAATLWDFFYSFRKIKQKPVNSCRIAHPRCAIVRSLAAVQSRRIATAVGQRIHKAIEYQARILQNQSSCGLRTVADPFISLI